MASDLITGIEKDSGGTDECAEWAHFEWSNSGATIQILEYAQSTAAGKHQSIAGIICSI